MTSSTPTAPPAMPSSATELLIDGDWVPGGGEPLVVREPATGEVLAQVHTADDGDLQRAVAGAVAVADTLERLTAFERAELLHATADALDRRASALAEQLTRESGKPLAAEATDELAESSELFRLAAEDVKRLETSMVPSADPNKRVFTHRKPNGVYALITPWNFPMNIPAELVAAGLAGGNPLVLKPSELTPLSGVALAEAVVEAGWPAGSISVVHGGGGVGSALVTHDDVDGIGFVGSADTARRIVASAGMKRTLIEASGNGPQIVCADADLGRAADAAVYGAHFNGGQCCVATERLLVHRDVHADLVVELRRAASAAVLGDPLLPTTTLGPLNNEAVAAKVDAHIADAVAKGAEVLCGGSRETARPTEFYYPLTVVDGVTPAMAIFREETFGPVVPITTFADDDEAIALANDSNLGLQAAVFTASLRRAHHFIDRLRAGSVIVNDSTCFWETHPPFGGASRTDTGWGRIGGKYTLLDMTDLRTAIIDIG